MIPQISLPPNMGLPDATAIPSLPFSYPPFEMPRWTPIPPRVPEMAEPTVPNTSPVTASPTVKPKPRPQPQVQPATSPPVEQPELDTQESPPEEVINQTVVIELPVIGEIPVPTKELLITAGSTAAVAASVSVVAALSAGWLVKFLMKILNPIMKFVLKKILKKRNKFTESWARKRRAERLHRRK